MFSTVFPGPNTLGRCSVNIYHINVSLVLLSANCDFSLVHTSDMICMDWRAPAHKVSCGTGAKEGQASEGAAATHPCQLSPHRPLVAGSSNISRDADKPDVM